MKIRGYKTIHTSTKRIKDKTNDNGNNKNNNNNTTTNNNIFQIVHFNVSHMESLYGEWKTKKSLTSPAY